MALNIKVLDGGLSTQLLRYVGQVDGDPLWTARFVVTRPDDIVQTHLDFLRAGSDIIETFTYQCSVEGYKKYLQASEDDALLYIGNAGKLALKARHIFKTENPSANPEIIGSIGPYGAILHDGSEYTGNYADRLTLEMLRELHKPRLDELIKIGIRMFAFETIPSRKEALLVLELLKEYPNIKCWLSFSCKDNKCISNGDDFKTTALECYNLNARQIMAVGVNCLSPIYVSDLFRGINEGREEKDLIPLVVYPNSGEKYIVEIGWATSPDHVMRPIHTFVDEWIELGVRFVGGCCRTHSEDVALIKEEVSKWRSGE